MSGPGKRKSAKLENKASGHNLPKRALAGLKVLDLTHHIAGPYCTKLVADLGADVLKVERPCEGDEARRWAPFAGDDPDIEKGILFQYLNANKKSVTLNLKSTAGSELFKSMVRESDVVVENFAPRVMPGLGISFEDLESVKPGLIMTSISNFGQTGPYRDYKADDITESAMSGLMYISGSYDREPLKQGLSQAQMAAGANAAVALLTALYQQRATGLGQHVDVSIMETVMSLQGYFNLSYGWVGTVPRRVPRGASRPFGKIVPCKDGYIAVVLAGIDWELLAVFLGRTDLTGPELEKFSDSPEFEAFLEGWAAERNKHEIFHEAQELRIPWAMVQDVEDVLNCPQLASRQFFASIKHSRTGTMLMPGSPYKLTETPCDLRSPAPLLGEHNHEIYCERLGLSENDLGRLKSSGVI